MRVAIATLLVVAACGSPPRAEPSAVHVASVAPPPSLVGPAPPPPSEVDSIMVGVRKRAACLRALDERQPCNDPVPSFKASPETAARVFVAAVAEPDSYVAWVAYQEVLRVHTDGEGQRWQALPFCTEPDLAKALVTTAEAMTGKTEGRNAVAELGLFVGCIDDKLGLFSRIDAIARKHPSEYLRMSLGTALWLSHPRSPKIVSLLNDLTDDPDENVRQMATSGLAAVEEQDPTASCNKLLAITAKPNDTAYLPSGVEFAFGDEGKCRSRIVELLSQKLPKDFLPRDFIFRSVTLRCRDPMTAKERATLVTFATKWAAWEKTVTPPQGTHAREALQTCQKR